MRIGVLGFQGDVSEHIKALSTAMDIYGHRGTVVPVRNKEQLEQVAALVIPGGESTTISRHIVRCTMYDLIVEKARQGMPVMGTCAGCILLAKKGDEDVEKTNTRLLSLMDMEVIRNAYGRQRESFEAPIRISGLDRPFLAIFIRAPAIKKVWGKTKALARLGGDIVMAKQDALLALTFHPELGNDLRVHEIFLQEI